MKKRNSGIDILKIIAMFMILFIHLLGEGGIISTLQHIGGSKYYVVSAIVVAFYCHVNCYGLISGYLGVQKQSNYLKIFLLWSQVIFYSLGGTLLLFLIGYTDITTEIWKKTLFPISSGTYWYMTAYFGMLIFIPLMNPILKKMTATQLMRVCLVSFFLFSFFPTILSDSNKFLGVNQGLSTIWLINLYLIGALLYKIDLHKIKNVILCVIYFSSIFVTVLMKQVFKADYWLMYSSPTILLSAISVFILFSRIQIPSNTTKKVLAVISSLTLGVYLLHFQPMAYELFLKNKLTYLVEYPFVYFIISLLGISILVFSMSLLIDYLRLKFFERIQVRRFWERLLKRTFDVEE
ncbi:acyltransferase [Streptococcus ovis]|uniref:acyltransferase n=1 Tax=Streptococcus ovis TaxID=82806 RepID=UPI000373B3FD|nr:acyltransferase family protein [Streptococcus ovis]